MHSTIYDDWQRRTGVLATMHGKESVIAPLMHAELGISIVVPKDFNTDHFGTFTREVARAGDQIEAARAKALAAMTLTGLDLGFASEGSFGPDPQLPLVISNLEIVVLIDARHKLEIIGQYRTGAVTVRTGEATTVDAAVKLALAWGFPAQGVIIRLSPNDKKHVYKDLQTVAALQAVSGELLSRWCTRRIFLETDMRAHRCPARQRSIELATIDLIKNCRQVCPRCMAPGFVVVTTRLGLSCKACGAPTSVVKAVVYRCQKCTYEEERSGPAGVAADPADCEWCNP